MAEELKPEVTSEVSLTDTVNPISVGSLQSEIKKEFSLSEPNSHDGFVEHTVESIYAGTNLKLNVEEEVQTKAVSEVWVPAFDASTSDAFDLIEIKKEFSLSDPYTCDGSVECDIVKHEDTTIYSLDQIKTEVPDLKCDIVSCNDDIYIKVDPLAELHRKDEVEESLVDETIKVSTEVEYLNCGLCNSKFQYKNSLQRHMKTHKREKSHKCSVCDYRSIRKFDLERHIKQHTGEKLFKCSLCDYRCILKSNLHKHMKTHTGEKPFQCSMCDHKCGHKNALKEHMKRHTGEKPFKCYVCDYRCINKGNLERHIKTHTGEKPHKCSLCDYRCIHKSDLQQHVKRHTREKLFLCNICGSKFKYKRNLKKHVKIHVGEQLS